MIESTQIYTHNPYPTAAYPQTYPQGYPQGYPQSTLTAVVTSSPESVMPTTTHVIVNSNYNYNSRSGELLQHKRCLFGVNLAWMWILWIFLMLMGGLAVGAGNTYGRYYNTYYSPSFGYNYFSISIYTYTPSWVSVGATLYVSAALLLIWIIVYTSYGGCLLCGCCCCNDIRNET